MPEMPVMPEMPTMPETLAGATTRPVAVLDRVSYYYPGAVTPALRDVSLVVEPGEMLGVIGPTGAGKSTLCLLFNGIVPQFHGGRFFGSVRIGDDDTVDHPISHLARQVGVVFQDPETQLIATSVENEIAFPLENLGISADEIRRRIPDVLHAVRLDGLERKRPDELSGGQKQRLAIAAALATRPRLLVLDEPTSQLDPAGEEAVFSVLRRVNREQGVTVILASHAAEPLAAHADRIAFFAEGRLVALGPPGEIYAATDVVWQHHLRPPQVSETFHRIRQACPAAVPGRVPVTLAEGLSALEVARGAARCTAPVRSPSSSSSSPPAGPALLSVRDLAHRYPDGTEALRGVSLDIRRGEYVVLLGQNGAGKSTLVRHFLNLLRPQRGRIQLDGTDTHALTVSELARRIGYVAQNPDHQIFSSTVAAEVGFALRHLGYPPGEITARTEQSLEQLGLLDARGAHPLSLPKGDRARVVIAAVLAMQPEILILDEPTIGQDFRGARYILDLTQRLHRQGKTILVITHHLYLMPGYAERALVMGRGILLGDAPLREVYHRTELLDQTYLVPPQAVVLAQALGRAEGLDLPLVTPAEVACCFAAKDGAATNGAPAEVARGFAAKDGTPA
jgi:energy-coupling factor transport system ATP-binding protein